MIAALCHRTAAAFVRAAARLLPSKMRGWGEAMRHEVGAIDPPLRALLFAAGCLSFAVRHRLASPIAYTPEPATMTSLLDHPRRLAATCAIAATGLGLAYLAAAEAPARHLATNGGALVIGFLLAGLALLGARAMRQAGGTLVLTLGAGLLLAALGGMEAGGATRWLSIGPLFVQPSLIVLPVMVLLFARHRTRMAAAGITIAALALALQPDRATAGALVAGLAALAVARRETAVLAALAMAVLAFAATLAQPDTQGAMPFVDQIFYSAFLVHPLAGAAVIGGTALLLLPALVGLLTDPARRDIHAAFGALWLAIVVAAALGNYPTPLVGYGASAIIGYVLSLLALPKRTRGAESIARSDVELETALPTGELRIALPRPA